MRISDWSSDVCSSDLVAHLDKSHITVHTYPETHPQEGIATFRADIDVATCGVISPLKALNYLIESFESDIVIADYRVRGFTRDIKGKKHYIDHKINSIQDFQAKNIKTRFEMFRSEEHTSELQSLMRISYAVFCLKKKKETNYNKNITIY